MASIPGSPFLRLELREEREVRQFDAQLEDEHGLAARVGDEEGLRVAEAARRQRTSVLGGCHDLGSQEIWTISFGSNRS